jgi:hypothetical protein
MRSPTPLYTAPAAASSHVQYVLHRDYETRSRAILKTVGAQRYAADPSTEVLCACYAAGDGEVRLWRPDHDPVPIEFVLAAENQNWLAAAHNDSFEAAIEKQIMAPRYGWPIIPIERHRCTMAAALACGLPAKLSAVADALELTNRKDAAGERLMHQTSKPRFRTRTKTLTVYFGLLMRDDLLAFLLIVPKTFELNASYITNCRHYHRPNEQSGNSAIRLTFAAFV